ncbi:MAG: hypothetical protein K0M48_12290 [Thiobacillus sp.]|nr:hypothetical protein [Thiobacillus sp.]
MLRTLLIATALLTATGTALAHSDYGYGRVVSVEPQFSISFGTRHHDGFRVLYESGGSRYWTHTPHHPGHVIVLPQHHYRVKHVHHYRDSGRGWDDRRDDWRDDRREYRSDRRDHRRHGRD